MFGVPLWEVQISVLCVAGYKLTGKLGVEFQQQVFASGREKMRGYKE
jgi:hypothetical protein